jgi:hypothetical protein
LSVRKPILLLLLIAAACAPSAGSTTPLPTLTLIPATATATPTPVPPSATPANLPAPQDVIRPTEVPSPESSFEGLIGEALIARDPVAAALVAVAERSVAANLNLPTRLVRLVDVRPATWTDSAFNCPTPKATVVPLQTDGYRIALRASGKDYLFHSDFDRVVPCDPANEKLPEGFVLPTEEPTDEATSELTPEVTEPAP